MIQALQNILKQQQVLFHQNQGVTVATVTTLHDGYGLVGKMLTEIVDNKTALYLSGGSTPKVLYERLAKEEAILPGAVGMIDERYGEKFHEKSNEKMIQETGLLTYLKMRDVPFYPILQRKDRAETAKSYDEKLRTLNATYQKSIAVMGIGTDGHTASIIPNRADPSGTSGQVFTNPMFEDAQKYLLVSEFDDPKSPYGERIGMTFLGLSMLDTFIILAFGEDKKKPLELMFSKGDEKEIPARFFTRPEIAKKTLLLTDQQI